MSTYEDLGDLLDGGKVLGDIGAGINISAADAAEVAQEAINSVPKGLDGVKAEVKDGKLEFERNGNPIDLQEANNDLFEGDLKGALSNMGIDDDYFETGQYKNMQGKWYSEYENSDVSNLNDALNDSNQTDKTVAGKGVQTDPQTPQEMSDQAKKLDLDKKIKDLEDQIKKLKEEGKSKFDVGKYIRYSLVLAGVVVGGELIYNWIKDHQHAMNGCWYIDTTTGNKCKVKQLTCDDNDLDTPTGPLSESFTICGNCSDLTKCGAAFIPLPVTGSSPCDSKAAWPGLYNPKGVGKNTCTPGKGAVPACPNASLCITRSETCVGNNAGSDSAISCDCGTTRCSGGYILKTVSVGFWGAAGDLLGKVIDFPGQELSNILEFLKKLGIYLAIALAIFLGIFGIYKLVTYIITKRHKNTDVIENNKSAEDVKTEDERHIFR